ncbi:MAG TPA: MFS transporter [Planctomycetaceae bacterium]|nr:MFS transporter [Planctomycetaceae bacterium]
MTHLGEAGEIAAATDGRAAGSTETRTAGTARTDGRPCVKSTADTQTFATRDTTAIPTARAARTNPAPAAEPESRKPDAATATRERIVVLMLASVQFISIVDFMIIMPLGPQLMRKLAIGPQQFGLVVASYTIAAGCAGFIASSLVDRLGRKAAFLGMDAGFLIGTFLCGLAPTYSTLVLARVLTGAFGGILGGLALAIIGDVFPEERRGRATGALMSGFALASVAGVPFGLYLGTHFGWHVPFILLGILGCPVWAMAASTLPPLRDHLAKATSTHPLRVVFETFTHPNHLNAFALIVMLMVAAFTIFPYMAPFLVSNIHMTEDELGLVYIAGGAVTLFSAPLIGRLADRYGKLRVFRIVAPLSAALTLAAANLVPVPVAVAVAIMAALMVCNTGRMVAAMAMITGSVEPHRRGGFLSANASVQHLSIGFGTYLGGLIVAEAADGHLLHVPTLGVVSAAATMLCLWLAGRIRPLRPTAEHHITTTESLAAAAEMYDAAEPVEACEEG